jgi:hypothetical protein
MSQFLTLDVQLTFVRVEIAPEAVQALAAVMPLCIFALFIGLLTRVGIGFAFVYV